MEGESQVSSVENQRSVENHGDRQLSRIIRLLRRSPAVSRNIRDESEKIISTYNLKENWKEYVCPDCGTVLRHYNHATLDSLKNIHEKLCPVKRRRSLDAEHIKLAKL